MSARASSRGRPVELEEALAAIRAGAREADDHAAMMSRRSEVIAVGDVMAELTQRKEQLEVQRRVRLEKDWITSRPGGGTRGGAGGGRPARRGRRHLAPALLAVEIMAAGGRLAPVASRIP